MPNFVFSYRQPTGYTPSADSFPAWRDWFGGMGDQLADLGRPVVDRASVGNCSREGTELGGYSVIRADDMEAALALANGCPHLERNGGVEVGLLGEIPSQAEQ